MKATTVKVEGELLEELNRVKQPSQSLSAFIRSVLRREVMRHKMAAAAEEYAQFLRDDENERSWLDEWDRADLASPPARRRK
jgi:hypothetical protein